MAGGALLPPPPWGVCVFGVDAGGVGGIPSRGLGARGWGGGAPPSGAEVEGRCWGIPTSVGCLSVWGRGAVLGGPSPRGVFVEGTALGGSGCRYGVGVGAGSVAPSVG